jgi:protein transport protein SEC31
MFTPSVGTNSTSRFMPPSNQGFVQRPGLSPVQPSSPTQAQAQAQPAPPAPPPTVQTADTSKVSGMCNDDAWLLSNLFSVSLLIFLFHLMAEVTLTRLCQCSHHA